jgi:acyl carrier protein
VRPLADVDDAKMMDLRLRRVLDSLDMPELIAYLEATFGFKMSDHEVVGRNFDLICSVADFFQRKVESAREID